MVKNKVVMKMKDVGVFPVQMDSTQNISARDQCSIVLRYIVSDRAKEKLVCLVNVNNSSKKYLHMPSYKIRLQK